MGHFDIWCQIVHIANGLHTRSGRNKGQFYDHIPTMFNCFPFKTLTEIADNETCACLNNTPAIYRGGLLQPHSPMCTYGLGLHSYGAFSNAPRSPSVWACIRWALIGEQYGAFDHFVARGVLVNASTINLRYCSDVGGVRRSRRQADR